jgi:hypothetical protein
MFRKQNPKQLLTVAAIAVAVATATSAGVAVAGSGGDAAQPTATTAARAGGILGGVHGALQALVAQGTISQTQADAVQRQADAGSIDPKSLVDGGVVSDAQMHAIANSVDQVKRAAA